MSMKLVQKFREQMSGFLQIVQDEHDSLIGQIQSFLNVEHVDDGTHATTVGGQVSLVAGESIGRGQAVYIGSGANNAGAGRGYLTDATSTALSTQAMLAGISIDSVSPGETVRCRWGGLHSGFAGLVPGIPYYLAAVKGAITATAPANAKAIGFAVAADTLFVLVELPATFAGVETLTYTGTSSGVQNMRNTTQLTLGVGSYTVAVSTAMTLTFKGCAGGGGATSGSGNLNGGAGGGGGATTTSTTLSLVSGKTYTLVVGAKGAGGALLVGVGFNAGTAGAATTFVNSTDSITLVSLGGGGGGGAGGAGGVGGALVTGSNGVTGGTGAITTGSGNGLNGSNATNGCAGGGGGSAYDSTTGGNGGTGSATGGGGGVGANGGNNGGLAATGGNRSGNAIAGGGGGGGGAQFTGVTGAFGGGGGGGGGAPNDGTSGGAGGAGQDGIAALIFVSAP